MTLYLLYIDPGTGSALFSIIIGIAAAAYFAVQAVLIKGKAFFTRGRVKTGAKNKYVIYAEDKRYWTLFKPVVEEFETRGIGLLYLTSSQDDPVFDAGFQHIKPELLGEGNKAFARLNFLSADFVLATTPGLDVYQWKRSKMVKHYSHILHMLSEATIYELFGLDYYDSVLVNGHDYQENCIRKLENARNLPNKQVIVVGCPYMDEYSKKINQISDELSPASFTVLVSPSWGQPALLSRFGENLLDPLVKTGWRIIVRPHPQSLIVEKEMLDRLRQRYSQDSNLEWDFERDNIYSLKKADVMISDYSGIILDYMFLRNKPVIYVSGKQDLRSRDAFEIYDDPQEMWTFRNLKKTAIELQPELLNELPQLISRASVDTALDEAIGEAKAQAWHYQGEAGKMTADFMIKTVEEMETQSA